MKKTKKKGKKSSKHAEEHEDEYAEEDSRPYFTSIDYEDFMNPNRGWFMNILVGFLWYLAYQCFFNCCCGCGGSGGNQKLKLWRNSEWSYDPAR